MELHKHTPIEMPVMEIKNFTLYELDATGITSLFSGSNSQRFADRDRIENINYTDSSKKLKVNIKADSGIHKGENIDLRGDVMYLREDGLGFKSEHAQYQKKSAIFSTDTDFIISKGSSIATGSSMQYDSKKQTTKATNIHTVYQLEESNK